jgi:hypothetical protein
MCKNKTKFDHSVLEYLVGRGNWHETRRRCVGQVALPHRAEGRVREGTGDTKLHNIVAG